MIIESAFYQLPELWVNANKSTGELDIASGFQKIISDRLTGFGVDARCSIEKAYGINKSPEKSGQKLAADIYIKVPYVWGGESLSGKYVIQNETWIEMKYFRPRKGKRKITINSSDLDKIKKDLLRLSILVKEDQGKHRDKSRYFCSLFYGMPNNSEENAYFPLDFDGQLDKIFSQGKNLSKLLFPIKELSTTLTLALDTLTYSFAPLPSANCETYSYWGYLVKIFGFSLQFTDTDNGNLKDLNLFYREPEGHFSQDDCQRQQQLGKIVIEQILSNS